MTAIPFTARRAPVSTAGEIRRRAEEALTRVGAPSPRADAAALAAHACGWGAAQFAKRLREAPPPGAAERLAALTARRVNGEPLQLIIGAAPFLGLDLVVAPGVFIPRVETEGLATRAEEFVAGAIAPVVVDLCAGVGPLAVYLGRRRPDARVIAVEVDERAASLLRRNAGVYDVNVEVMVGDVTDGALSARLPEADLIVSNPPYIKTGQMPALPAEIRDWEPGGALDGGADGLNFYPHIANLAAKLLRPGGAVAVEIGEDLTERASEIFGGVGDVGVGQDLAGRDRYLWARKAGGC